MIKVLFWLFIIWYSIYFGLVSYTHSNLFFASFAIMNVAIAVVNLVRLDQ